MKLLLIDMFSFIKLDYETEDEYKERVIKRINEILNGINCTLEETACLKALIEISDKNMLETLLNSNINNLDEYIYSKLFGSFNEKKFLEVRERIWNSYLKMYTEQILDYDGFGFDSFDFMEMAKKQTLEQQLAKKKKKRRKRISSKKQLNF